MFSHSRKAPSSLNIFLGQNYSNLLFFKQTESSEKEKISGSIVFLEKVSLFVLFLF